jgi:hypothetical protein
MRTIPLFLCLALAGCVTDGPPDTTASAAAGPGRSAHAAAPKDEWWTKGGVTRDKISAMCWMKFEQGCKDVSIDKRADLVEQCIDDASRQYGVQ